MKKTIKELELESECSLYDAMCDYVDSCIRTNHHDEDDNINFFMKENDMKENERDSVVAIYKEVLKFL